MILEEIVNRKLAEVKHMKVSRPLCEIKAALKDVPPPRPFEAALVAQSSVALIAELKKASPSKGVIRHDFAPTAIAQIYAENGASALSVLTEVHFFQGHPTHIRQVRERVTLPILRKDFIVDPYQIYESRLLGADAVLLIASLLEETCLVEFIAISKELGMDCLVEAHSYDDLEKVLASGASLIGINNRNLRTLTVDIETTMALSSQVPQDRVLVSESGIRTPADVIALAQHNVKAVLVGEALLEADDLAKRTRELAGVRRYLGVD